MAKKEIDREERIEEMLAERVQEELTPVDTEARYDEMLDQMGPVEVGSLSWDASRVLKEMDPTAYRCGFNDWLDGEDLTEIDGEYYETSEVDDLRSGIEDEIDAEDEDADDEDPTN